MAIEFSIPPHRLSDELGDETITLLLAKHHLDPYLGNWREDYRMAQICQSMASGKIKDWMPDFDREPETPEEMWTRIAAGFSQPQEK